MTNPANLVERLLRLDVCAVSDAMDKLGFSGAGSGLDQCSTRERIAGRVVTMRLVARDHAPPPSGMWWTKPLTAPWKPCAQARQMPLLASERWQT